jgi:hypothetical protein
MTTVPRVPVEGSFELGTGQVTLSIVVGEGQQGFSLVKVEDEEKGEGEEITNLELGTSDEVRGKRLFIDTDVTVTNPLTMRTSVRYTLKQGATEQNYDGSKTLGAVGDSVIYEGEIDFKAEEN